MAFPYSISKTYKIEFPETEQTPTHREFKQQLFSIFSCPETTEILGTEDGIDLTVGILGLKYPIKIEIPEQIGQTTQITYHIKFIQLLQFTIVALLVSAFIASFSFRSYLIFAVLATLFIYGGGQLMVRQFIRSKFERVFGHSNRGEGEFSKAQKEWINDPVRCPACGENIDENDPYCPSCGLKLKQNPHSIPLDVSKYSQKSFRYHFKENKPPQK